MFKVTVINTKIMAILELQISIMPNIPGWRSFFFVFVTGSSNQHNQFGIVLWKLDVHLEPIHSRQEEETHHSDAVAWHKDILLLRYFFWNIAWPENLNHSENSLFMVFVTHFPVRRSLSWCVSRTNKIKRIFSTDRICCHARCGWISTVTLTQRDPSTSNISST